MAKSVFGAAEFILIEILDDGEIHKNSKTIYKRRN